MTTRSFQHNRSQIQQKFPPNNLHSRSEPPVKKIKSDASIKSEPGPSESGTKTEAGQSKSQMKTDEEDEMLASPQASQVSGKNKTSLERHHQL